jgi:hypothetical protein
VRRSFVTTLFIASAIGILPAAAAAQSSRDTSSSRSVAPGRVPAARRDVESMEAILAALYDVISGPANTPRDWGRFRSLFAPGARLIPTQRSPEGITRSTVLTVQEFEQRVTPALAAGFYEREVGRHVDRFGAVVHVMSAYESKHTVQDAKPFSRGVNSIQLLDAGDRWYVVTVFWDVERPDNPIPGEYAPR